MGDLIVLAERRADRSRAQRTSRPRFYFDLACPFSYLVAERVERVLGDVEWIPVAGNVLRPDGWADHPRVRAHAEGRAAALRLPLSWPDLAGWHVPGAMRAASYAGEIGAGARFALAASRLAYCGGFDLEDPEILAEAAAAAGMSLSECLAAARDMERDRVLEATARGLGGQGVLDLPALGIGPRFFAGENALAECALMVRAPSGYGPLAPAG